MSRAAPLVAAALLLAGCGGSETTTQQLLAPTTPADTTPSAPVEETGLHLACAGEGSPTVVLEAGLGSASDDWQPLQRELASLTRTCRYDRAGLGLSPLPAGGGVRTAATQVEELAAALEDAGAGPPYVLAGHSYGGVLARVFAHAHPDLVAGLVFVDTPHPDERERYLAALPPEDNPVLNALRAQLTARHDPSGNPERLDWEASMAEARGAVDLGDLPLVVVTAGQSGPRAAQSVPPELVEQLDEVRLELQAELARLSPEGIHVVATESGHAVADPGSGQPEVIVAAVEALVHTARQGAPLPACADVFAGPRTRCLG